MSPSIRVMLADDHEAIRQGLRALFATVPDIEVVMDVGDAEGAVDEARRLAPDVVVVDLSMPKAGGLTVIRQIRAARSATAIVVLTRHRDVAFVHEALSAGASGYVLKQSPFSELRRAIEQVFGGGRYVDSGLKTVLDASPVGFTGQVSHREREVLRRTVLGHSNKEIASALSISVKTVEVHKTNGMRKLDLRDRGALVRYGAMHGWLLEP